MIDGMKRTARSDMASGIDLETWRSRERKTYEELATALRVSTPAQARRYAMGERWPDPDLIDRIAQISNGEVTLLALHQRRSGWLRRNKNARRSSVCAY